MAKKSFWKMIWEPEDSHLFGELFLIIGAILLAKFLELILPTLSKWIYLAIGFLFVLYGIKLIRRS